MEQKQRLELIYDMTSHPGWKVLVEDLTARVEALKEGLVTNESSPYQVGLAQGHIKVYREMTNLRSLIDMVLKDMQQDEEEEHVEADAV